MTRSDSLVANVVAFGRLLRRIGIGSGTEETRRFLEALDLIGFHDKRAVRAAGRSVFVRRREERELFDRAFELFWRRQGRRDDDGMPLPKLRQDSTPLPTFPANDPDSTHAMAEVEMQPVARLTSDREMVRRADFAALTPEETRDALAMVAALRPALPTRRSRRWAISRRRGRRVAQGRMLRRALATAGEPLVWRWLDHPERGRQLVFVCDISGSMERYSRFMLRFAHALTAVGAPVEVFVFGTRLTRITRDLALRDADQALQRVGKTVVDWNGGTRIGESLHELNRRWVRRVIRGSAIVMICSDGWERGDPAILAGEMARLRRSCYRLIWLDPLAGHPDFVPEVAGLKAALPFVHMLLPCGSVASLEELAERLAAIGVRRSRVQGNTGMAGYA
ncbi:MAG: VWA domain-containing protein [Gemmatimonadota bacterium]